MQKLLSLEALLAEARVFARHIHGQPLTPLYGVTDGKAIGTFVEAEFNAYLFARYVHAPGNAAKGIDFPELNVDLKVTSIKQPQSSCPFRDATQKVYGLGYHLLVFVYDKKDDTLARAARLDFLHVIFVESTQTSDYQITRGIREILSRNGSAEDIDAYLQDRNLPLDAETRRQLAERLLAEPPVLGVITISNALQWRLQYGHAIRAAVSRSVEGVRDLLA